VASGLGGQQSELASCIHAIAVAQRLLEWESKSAFSRIFNALSHFDLDFLYRNGVTVVW
jgi:hypothetical protein